jgi:excisionase family DNA binding protein
MAAPHRTGTLSGSNRLLTSREVAAILCVRERTVRAMWREWELPAYRTGKQLRWRERDVHAWIDPASRLAPPRRRSPPGTVPGGDLPPSAPRRTLARA